MKKYDVALIGAGGFIGAEIWQALSGEVSVLSFGRSCPPIPSSSAHAHVFVDLLKDEGHSTEPVSVKTVIYCAAKKSWFDEGTEGYFQQGKVIAPNFDELLARLGIFSQRLITIGTSEEYGPRHDDTLIFEDVALNPVSSYSYWKTVLLDKARAWSEAAPGRQVVHLRPFNVFGLGLDRNMFLGALITAIRSDRPFKMTMGEQYRSFVPVRILNEAISKLVAMESWPFPTNPYAINVSTDSYMQLRELAEKVAKIAGKGDLQIGVLPYRSFEVWHQRPDLTRLEALLGHRAQIDMDGELRALYANFDITTPPPSAATTPQPTKT